MSEILSQDLKINDIQETMEKVRNAANTNMVGQAALDLANDVVKSMFARQHYLAEGVPGVAKTQTAKNLSAAIYVGNVDLETGDELPAPHTSSLALVKPYGRAQGAPDRQPADILGAMIFNQKTGDFEAKPGPAVAHFVLFDEINRYRSPVQPAINELGSEGQITLGDQTIYLPKGFFMMGTMNPNVHGEGTNNQASSVADRFGMSSFTDMPSADERYEAMQNRSTNSSSEEVPSRVFDMAQLPAYQDAINRLVKFNPGVIRVGANILHRILTDVQKDSKGNMTNPEYAKAPGFRAGDAVVDLARSKAAMAGQNRVDMDMLTAENGLLYSVLRHRVVIDGDPQGKLNQMIADAVKDNSTVLSREEAAAKI